MATPLLADESCDFAIVRALRKAGYEVAAVSEISPRADDDVILALAADETRIVLTEDKDFGELVYAKLQANCDVILIRSSAKTRSKIPKNIVTFVSTRGDELHGRFVVVQPGRIRIRRKPKPKNSAE